LRDGGAGGRRERAELLQVRVRQPLSRQLERGNAHAALRREGPRPGRSKLATLAPAARYTVAAGKRRTIVLKLGRDGRTLMKSRRSLRARVALKPGRGAAVTRVVTLRR
jgi:hypothetical protein